MSRGTEFFVLGPLRVCRGGRELRVPPGKTRALLAALLLAAGRAVGVDELVDVLWGAAPPPSARVALQNHVMRLRRTLGDGTLIRTSPYGYQVRLCDGELDLSRFEAHLAAARSAARDGDWDAVAARARAGLALWRGEPLADVDSDLLATRDVPRLAELRLQACELGLDADLHLGRHREAIAELRSLTAGHPLRERLHGLLMLALYRDGQRAGALAAYAGARTILDEELGTEPGTALRDLHRRILTGDPGLDLPAAVPVPVPRELPAPVPQFTGRGEELAALTRLLEDGRGQATGTVAITAIGGTAGVGKTALALHWAHQVADRFPDGQLYVDLRGFAPAVTPMARRRAIRGFLDALGVPPERVPATPDALMGLYRSLLADRAMLIVLDNARDEAQVRSLLPASPGSLVLVTSRSQLSGLAAAEGARLLPVDVLGRDEAVELLAARVGRARAAAEPDAVTEIAGLCAGLPLALGVAAARAVAQPGFTLTALAAELRDTAGRLDALDTGDPAASVRAVFSWSYRQLSPGAARMFRLLGLHPGPDASVSAAASLAAADEPGARRELRELARAHLISEHAPGRYAFHDLLRAYAADRARDCDREPERREAIGRVLDHYLHTANTGSWLLYPTKDRLPLGAPRPGAVVESQRDRVQALAWFQAEWQVLLAAVRYAAAAGLDGHAWRLAAAMTDFLGRQGHRDDLAAAQRVALTAARRAGDPSGRAHAHLGLGVAAVYDQGTPDASAHLKQAISLFRQTGDTEREARSSVSLGVACAQRGGYSEACRRLEYALRIYRDLGHLPGQALALTNLGAYLSELRDYQAAAGCCERALALHTETGNLSGAAHALGHSGDAWQGLGDHARSVDCYHRALRALREASDPPEEARVLTRLGDVHRAAGDLPRARRAWRQALTIFEDLGRPDADKVRARLREARE